MSLIQKPDTQPLVAGTRMGIDSMEVPSFRYLLAQQNRTLKNILIKTPFALGDCVCAEPAIRFAQKNFEGCTITVLTPFPELYSHIPNLRFMNTKDDKPNWDKYYVLECYHSADAFQSEFVHNFNMAIEDYICVSLFKGMIPVADRNIVLKPTALAFRSIPPQEVVIHAGKHWISKTFPKKWWDAVIHYLLAAGVKPTLVGAKVDDSKRGYVEVDATHCFDLRDKLTVMQSVAVLQQAQVVLTNDSAPYHMAASGTANIGVFSTVRHFDFIGHWRPQLVSGNYSEGGLVVEVENRWNHKITNLAEGQMWQGTDTCPGRNGAKYDVIDHATLMSWLPDPKEVADWTLGKLGRA